MQLDIFSNNCNTENHSYLHIDAIGSVVRKLKDQKPVYVYAMVFKAGEDPSDVLPLSGALLCNQAACSISSYFNCVLSQLALRSKNTLPSFVVIDFSTIVLNSVLSSFNVETVRSYLRRCFHTLNFAYTAAESRDTTFVRLCCAHVMQAFSRSLCQIKLQKLVVIK